MIKFSAFLQDNEMKKKKSEKKKEQEIKEIAKKDKIISQKKFQKMMLERQTWVINKKVSAMKEYETYLMKVIEEHKDEYTDINDIVSRYDTLKESNWTLKEYQERVNNEFE